MEEKGIVKYETDRGEIKLSPNIVRRYLVNGRAAVTDQEVMMFMALCKYQGLNPFLREAYLIKYSDNNPATVVVGKETFTKRAAGLECCDGWEAGIIVQVGNKTKHEAGCFAPEGSILVGGWAKVHRKNWKVPIEATVSLKEYMRYDKGGAPTRAWASMPATMIRKVALVQALREAYPEKFQGMYAQEEMPTDGGALPEAPVEMHEEAIVEDTEKQAKVDEINKDAKGEPYGM